MAYCRDSSQSVTFALTRNEEFPLTAAAAAAASHRRGQKQLHLQVLTLPLSVVSSTH